MPAWKRSLLSVFVLFHLGSVLVWIAPDGAPIKTAMNPVVEPYLVGSGLWQYWNMFSPDPANLNLYVYAEIWYPGDPNPRHYELPRMDRLDFISRYEQERFRKYIENVHNDDHNLFWPDLARWIAKEDARQVGKKPERIQLWRRWWFVAAWQPGMTVAVDNWQQFKFYETRLVDGKPVDKPTIGPPL